MKIHSQLNLKALPEKEKVKGNEYKLGRIVVYNHNMWIRKHCCYLFS